MGKKSRPAKKAIGIDLHTPAEEMSTPVLSLLLSTCSHVGDVARNLSVPMPVNVELTVGGATVSASVMESIQGDEKK